MKITAAFKTVDTCATPARLNLTPKRHTSTAFMAVNMKSSQTGPRKR
nr:hypothetical protein [Lactobacillus delbrueckii]